jgi:signal transduction histidine kinase
MNPWYYTRHRSELVLCAMRLLLAIFSSIALASDLFAARTELAHWLAYSHFMAAVGLVIVVLRPTFKQPWRWRLHLVDLGFATLFLLAARPDTILAIGHFVFPLIASSLRFRWRAIFWSSLPIVAGYLVSAVAEMGRLSVRDLGVQTTALLFTVLVCVILAAYHERIHREYAELVWCEIDPAEEPRALLMSLFSRASEIMNASRILMVRARNDHERSYDIALYADGGLTERNDVMLVDPLVAPELEGVDFYCRDLAAEPLVTDAGELFEGPAAIAQLLRSDYRLQSVVACETGYGRSGRIFYLDAARLNSDVLALARSMTDVVTIRIEQNERLRDAETRGAGEERTRLARDLHDGLLQSLTGASLQIEAVRRLVDGHPEEAKLLLKEIQDVLAVDQHEVRFFVDWLRLPSRRAEVDLRSGARFSTLTAIVQRQWGVEVEFRLDSLHGISSKSRRREIHRLIREAVFNAARHSGAKRITVIGEQVGEAVSIVVSDNGKGFPFQGRYDLLQLNQMRFGPVTVKERVAALGGDLVVDSSAAGARLEIRVPLIDSGARA